MPKRSENCPFWLQLVRCSAQ